MPQAEPFGDLFDSSAAAAEPFANPVEPQPAAFEAAPQSGSRDYAPPADLPPIPQPEPADSLPPVPPVFFPFVTDDGQPVQSVFPMMGQPGAPYPAYFPAEAADAMEQLSAQPVDEIAAFFEDKPFAAEQEAPAAAPVEAPRPQFVAAKPELPPEGLDPFAPAETPEKKKRPEFKPAPQQQPVQPQRPPIRWQRVAAMVAMVGMLLFVGIVGGRVVANLAANERDMKALRQQWNERTGTDLRAAAARVDLLPEGQTYAPTATPAPTQVVRTPTPTPIIPINEAAIQSLGRRDNAAVDAQPVATPTAPQRSRLEAYPDNPLKNVMDSVREAHDQNRDVIGHLVIEGVLDEWVVQRNNTYYLTRNYRGSASETGAVFADESCSLKTPPENLLLRGQSAVEGKLFAPLWQYASGGASFVAAHTRATLTSLYEEGSYVLFAVIVADNDPASAGYFNYASHPSFQTDEAMLRYVQSARERSLYPFNVQVGPADRLLTLATLGAGDSTLVLMFKLEP